MELAKKEGVGARSVKSLAERKHKDKDEGWVMGVCQLKVVAVDRAAEALKPASMSYTETLVSRSQKHFRC